VRGHHDRAVAAGRDARDRPVVRGALLSGEDGVRERLERQIGFRDGMIGTHRTGERRLIEHAGLDGIVVLIGATTENPFFSVNAPLVSRSQIFQFEPLSDEDIIALMHRALTDEERGLGKYHATITEDAAKFLAQSTMARNGRNRIALLCSRRVAVFIASRPRASGDPLPVI